VRTPATSRQIGTPYGQQYLADTLIGHAPIAAALVGLFEARFDPTLGSADNTATTQRTTRLAPKVLHRRLGEVTAMIDQVAGLDADRILRGYLNLITATLRTNYFAERPYLALKFDPGQVRELPRPRPRFEIFVYSPRVEGVHLRFGRSPGAGCAGRTGRRTSAPRCWGWSRPRR